MSFTKLVIATVVLAALTGLIYWVTKHPQDKNAGAEAAPKIIDVPEAQIQSIEVAKKSGPAIGLSKANGKWTITAPQNYAADQDAAVAMASALSGVNAESLIEEAPTDVSKFGLDAPVLTVTAHEKGGKTDTLFFGNDTPVGSAVYVRLGKDPKVYSASASLKTSFNKELNDLRDKRLLTFDSARVSRLELVSPKSDIEFGKVNTSDWQIVKPAVYRADSFQVDDVLRKLSETKMDLTAKAVADAAKSARNIGTAKITSTSGVQELDVSQNKDDYYAKSSVVPGVFKISSDVGQAIGKGLDSFRNKKVFDFGFSDTNRIEWRDKVFIRSGTDWKSGNQMMDPGAVQALVDKLRDLSASAFVTEGFGNADITATVVSNDGKRTEKVEFSKTADGYVARQVGQPALYKLDAKAVNDIAEAASAIKVAAPTPKK